MKEVNKYYLITREYEFNYDDEIEPILKVIGIFDTKEEAKNYIEKENLTYCEVFIKKFPEIE